MTKQRVLVPGFMVVASILPLACSGGSSGGDGGRPGGGGTFGNGGAQVNGGTSGAGAGGTTTPTAGSSGSPTIAGCTIFPADNPWNQDVSALPVHPNSATYLANMSPGTAFHPDWGAWTQDHYGIPFETGTGATPQPMTWTETWGAEASDPLPCATGSNKFCYPIPLTARIEGGTGAATDSDRHVLYIDTAGAPNNCTLYELYNTQNPSGAGWTAINGAIFHLGSNALRPDGWTSADAAGLPILPGLVRLDEVVAGEIRHAIRFTVARSSQGYIHPATHAAGNSNTALPPMGLRLRLKASFNTSVLSGPSLIIAKAMKKYGILLADNGSNWYISGESSDGWAPYMDGLLAGLRLIHGSDFEVVDTGPVSAAGL